MNIGFVGAGKVALSLGNLFSGAGYTVKYGTHHPEHDQLSVAGVIACSEVVCFAVPFTAMTALLTTHKEALTGKIVVDITNPINSADWSPLLLGNDSGGEQTARLLPDSAVVKAFNTVFADVMNKEKQEFNGQKLTVFIASDNNEAAEIVTTIANDAGFHGLVVGGIKQARHLESIAHVNIAIALAGGGTDAGFIYAQRKN
ncbi:MAG: NAD(P)-binding domain-containing protein [Bacteroidetes bacterium]|nr:NAD(P)-binding domain-containing protein [Bacteroidota bacterium]